MKKRIVTIPVVLLLAISLLAIGCPPPPNDLVVPPPPPVVWEWKVQSWAPAGFESYRRFVAFTEMVKEMTDGRLVITPLPSGAIVGPFEKFDAVRAGIMPAMHSWSPWWTGKDPAFSPAGGLIATPMNEIEFNMWIWEGGGLELIRELYAKWDIFYVGPAPYGAESMHFRRPVTTVADFKGILFRSPPGWAADFVDRLGASIVVLPGGEIFSALEKGVIDGAEFMTLAGNKALGFHKVAPYFIHPGFHQPATAPSLTVCMQVWQELPADIQRIVEVAVRYWAMDALYAYTLMDLEAKTIMIEEWGNVHLIWDEAELAKVKEIAVEVWKEWAEKSPMSERMIRSQVEFLHLLGKMPSAAAPLLP